jgi:hypothetical protein
VTAEVANKLLVDINERSGLRSAGKVVGGDYLIADCGQSAGLCVAEEVPIALPACGAAYSDCSATQGSRRHKLTARQKGGFLFRLHKKPRRNRTHPEQGSFRNSSDICLTCYDGHASRVKVRNHLSSLAGRYLSSEGNSMEKIAIAVVSAFVI